MANKYYRREKFRRADTMDFSISLDMILPDVQFEKRVGVVAKNGFKNIEFWGWKNRDIEALEKEVRTNNVGVTLFSGHRKSSTIDSRFHEKFLKELKESISLAHKLGCRNLDVYSDEILPGKPNVFPQVNPAKITNLPLNKKYNNLVKAMEKGADLAEKEDVILQLEALNPYDHPRYFLSNSSTTLRVIRKVDNPHLKMLFDIYHMQISEGNITNTLLNNLDAIGYIHVADVPGRHEPGTGELNYEFILGQLHNAGFKGTVGFEYLASENDQIALGKIHDLISDWS
jgi:hydroxypyruvate isomerase